MRIFLLLLFMLWLHMDVVVGLLMACITYYILLYKGSICRNRIITFRKILLIILMAYSKIESTKLSTMNLKISYIHM